MIARPADHHCAPLHLDTRRKIILGGLLIDAAVKDQRFANVVGSLMERINRDQDRKAFDGWTLPRESE